MDDGTAGMRRRVLMIAFHYPPMRGSSGLQRTLTFSNYLPARGWDTTVLTAHERAYAETSTDQLADIGSAVRVLRAPCWDASRHFAIRGAYPRSLALPDRWASWFYGAVLIGWREVLRWRPHAIWSTFPIPSAHRIAARLHRLTGVPWIADLRDSMTEDHYPREPRVREAYLRVEHEVIRRASAIVFTAPSALRMYGDRYRHSRTELWHVIGNGYDEEKFREAESRRSEKTQRTHRLWLHSGLLDPTDRNPIPFFDAVAALKRSGALTPERVQIVLRATSHDAHYAPLLADRAIADIVKLKPPLPYGEALAEMLSADALLLFQAASCNHQIPAKLYEYLRARRPILCLTDPRGDTASVARSAGIAETIRLDDVTSISIALRRFLSGDLPPAALIPSDAAIIGYSRSGQATRLAEILDEVVSRS